MISYDPLWETMRKKGISQYMLIHKHHISPGQITRLKRNESVSTHTIDMFCDLLCCRVEDIMVYIRTDKKNADPGNVEFLSESNQLVEPLLNAAEKDTVYHDE